MLLESDSTKNSQNKTKINSSNYLHVAEYKNNCRWVPPLGKQILTKSSLKTFPSSMEILGGKKKKEKVYLGKEHITGNVRTA